MTSLEKRKSQLRIMTSDTVFDRGRRREVVIEAHPHYAVVRLKGMRSGFEISYAGIYNLAVKNHMAQERAAKKRGAK